MFDSLLVETKITTIITVVLYKEKQCYIEITSFFLEFSIMSIVLSVSQLCKHILKIDVDLFEQRKSKGAYKKAVPGTVTKIWENLEKIFPTSAEIVKKNVTKKTMHGAVRGLLTGKETDSVILFSFSENRETREGNNIISMKSNNLLKFL